MIPILDNFRITALRTLRFAVCYCDTTDKDTVFVRFTSRCPNACPFCFDRAMPHERELASARELAEKTNLLGRKVMLSGGEPCVDMKRLAEYVDALDPEKAKVACIMTSLPKQAWDSKDELKRLIRKCGMIDISSHWITDAADERVYGCRLGYGKQAFISELAREFPEKVFVSCVLTKSMYRNETDVEERLSHYWKAGVRNFYLNEIGTTRPFEKDPEYVAIGDLLPDTGIKAAYGSAFCRGCKVDLSRYFETDYPGITVKARRRCFRCGSGTETWGDVVKTFVNWAFRMDKRATPVLNENGEITPWFKTA